MREWGPSELVWILGMNESAEKQDHNYSVDNKNPMAQHPASACKNLSSLLAFPTETITDCGPHIDRCDGDRVNEQDDTSKGLEGGVRSQKTSLLPLSHSPGHLWRVLWGIVRVQWRHCFTHAFGKEGKDSLIYGQCCWSRIDLTSTVSKRMCYRGEAGLFVFTHLPPTSPPC